MLYGNTFPLQYLFLGMYNSSDIHSSDYISVSSTSASSSLSSHYYTQSETDISEIGRARFLDATSSDHAAVAAPTWHDGSCSARLPRKMQKEQARTIRHYYRTRYECPLLSMLTLCLQMTCAATSVLPLGDICSVRAGAFRGRKSVRAIY